MKVSIDQLKKGVATYLDTELIPLIDDGFKRVMVGAAVSIAITKYASVIPALNENKFIKTLDIIDGENNIDIETLYNAIQSKMTNDGFSVDVPVLGAIRFKPMDIEKIYKTITATK